MTTAASATAPTQTAHRHPLRVVPKLVGRGSDLLLEFDVRAHGGNRVVVQTHKLDCTPPRADNMAAPPPLAQLAWHVKSLLEENAALRARFDGAAAQEEQRQAELGQCRRECEKLANQLAEAQRRLNGKKDAK